MLHVASMEKMEGRGGGKKKGFSPKFSLQKKTPVVPHRCTSRQRNPSWQSLLRVNPNRAIRSLARCLKKGFYFAGGSCAFPRGSRWRLRFRSAA